MIYDRSMEGMMGQISDWAESLFFSSKGSHDWDHTSRVRNLCLRMGESDGADIGVLEMAAILHDIGRSDQDRSGGIICHAERGAEMAREILSVVGIENDMIEDVIHCIETHRFRGDKTPKSKEAKILYDSDKLDSIGAIGIGRAFLFSGEIGAKLHNGDVDIEKTEPYTRDDTAYREYVLKLSSVKDKMMTDAGKRLASERHDFMERFFKRLSEEVEGKL